MNDLQEEIKKSLLAAQQTGNKFAENPLWESQAWFLRTRVRFGNDYQQFWDHTQGQINDYVTNLNSEDQVKARAEVAESFTIALQTGFDDCNKQIDLLLQKVFQVDQIEDEDKKPSKQNPEIINLIDVEDKSFNQRVQVDPPSKFDKEKEKKREDPEPTTILAENNTVTSSIVAVLEESLTGEDDFHEGALSEIIDVSNEEDVIDIAKTSPRNALLMVATPHRTIEPEITDLVEKEILETIVESPEVIDLTHEHEVVDLEDVEEIGESLVGNDSRDDDEATPDHRKSLSLSSILLDTFNEETKDTPARAMWYDDSVLATIISRDTADEYEPTLKIVPSKSKEILAAVGQALFGTSDSATPESEDPINEGREGVDDSEQRLVEAEIGTVGSRMEPIDLTQI